MKKLRNILLSVTVLVIAYNVLVDPNYVQRANNSLYNLYVDIYKPVDCDTKEINGAWYSFCHPDGEDFGGLFRLEKPSVDDAPLVIRTVNGKGRSHLSRYGINLECSDGSPNNTFTYTKGIRPITFACNDRMEDIPAILAAFK